MRCAILCLGIFCCLIADVNARDLGQWEAVDPGIRQWYQALMQPDVPKASCCGEADACWADEIHVRDGKTYVTITDERPDEPHAEIGTEIETPNNKLKWDRSNPTAASVRSRGLVKSVGGRYPYRSECPSGAVGPYGFQNLPPVTSIISTLQDWKRSSTLPMRTMLAGVMDNSAASAHGQGRAMRQADINQTRALHVSVTTCVISKPVLPSWSRTTRHNAWEARMTWKAPKIVEVPVGMEINMYACAARK